MHRYRMGYTWVASKMGKWDLIVPIDYKDNMSQQHEKAAKKDKAFIGCISSRTMASKL